MAKLECWYEALFEFHFTLVMTLPRRRFLDRTLRDFICVVSIAILFAVVHSATSAIVLAFSLLLCSSPVDVVFTS